MSQQEPAPKPKNKPNKPRKQGKSGKKTNPQLLELTKLTKNFKPITVNGIPISSLSKPLPEFLNSATADQSNDLYLSFLIKPSDPDFPFDLDFLKLSLCIPGGYPHKGPNPSVVVLNEEIPKGYSANVEIGFREISRVAMDRRRRRPVESEIQMVAGNDLLSMFLTLDKNLERFLSMEKKDTIKFVKTIKKEKPKPQPTQKQEPKKSEKTKKPAPAELSLRAKEIDRFLHRLGFLDIKLFKETNQNSIYKFVLPFEDNSFTIAIDNLPDIVIHQLAMKLIVPKDYLTSERSGLKLEIDMSNSQNIGLVNSIEDKSLKLIFGKLISNINGNFYHSSLEMVKHNNTSITSQVNMFVQNIEKFLRPPADFSRWLAANEVLNGTLQTV
ncbi:hypothetical protein OGAPHI_006810 [Ogataea philodendri]|uniref:Uncharacterized protein n=1 Tax=Ogataea philodendri TaxID=1378263 RepID=A0A9P8NW60_9ASCO|nr:uncharacterized protein OGAPHI_006810 [Ogataea philodendri]KAH3661403.1 hypothetical protein OGAPHI_006810 [Ogataea philodendri]